MEFFHITMNDCKVFSNSKIIPLLLISMTPTPNTRLVSQIIPVPRLSNHHQWRYHLPIFSYFFDHEQEQKRLLRTPVPRLHQSYSRQSCFWWSLASPKTPRTCNACGSSAEHSVMPQLPLSKIASRASSSYHCNHQWPDSPN